MRRVVLVLFLLLSLATSAQQWRFWIDEQRPAQRGFLRDVSSVLLVNNTVLQPLAFGHPQAVDGVTLRQEEVDLSGAALHCMFSATQTLDQSGEFMRVELFEQTQNASDNFYSRNLLSAKKMADLRALYNVDALLILNQLVLYNIQETFPLDDGTHYAYLQAYAQSNWTVYSGTKSQSFSMADTLLWESEPMYARSRALEQLPATQEALLYLARNVGDSLARSLTPQWVAVPRYLYEMSDASIQAGLDAFRYQRWADAIHYWSLAMDGNDKKAAAMAAANIAIAYEMQGDFSSACDFARHAIRLFGAWKTAYARQQQVNIRYYLAQVQDRMAKERGL